MSASGDSEHLSHVESDMMEDPDFEGENLHDILETFFLESKKNRNVVDILLEIKRSLEMHLWEYLSIVLCNYSTHIM